MTPTNSTERKTEARIQQEAQMWFHNTFPERRGMLFEINNNSQNAREGMEHRCMGRVRGVSDMCLLVPGGRVVFVEFKTETGRQSEYQQNWEALVTRNGFRYVIIRSVVEFQKLVSAVFSAV